MKKNYMHYTRNRTDLTFSGFKKGKCCTMGKFNGSNVHIHTKGNGEITKFISPY